MNRTETLKAALSAVEQRGQAYGTPENNFQRIARRWNVHLLNRYGETVELDAADVAAMMADMKLARLEETPSHQDSWTDLAGYAACGAEVATEREIPLAARINAEMAEFADTVDAAIRAAFTSPTTARRDEVVADMAVSTGRSTSGPGTSIYPILPDEIIDDGKRV